MPTDPNGHHVLTSMLSAKRSRSAARDIKDRSRHTRLMQTTRGENMNHAIVSMRLAVRSRLRAFEIEMRPLCAGGMRATLAADVGHALLGVLLAVRLRCAAHNTEHSSLRAGEVRAMPLFPQQVLRAKCLSRKRRPERGHSEEVVSRAKHIYFYCGILFKQIVDRGGFYPRFAVS